MRTIIAGSRTAEYNDVLEAVRLSGFMTKISVVISGTASGADKHGEQIAEYMNLPVMRYPANWNKYGKRAGYLRNEEMANNAEALIAVWDGESKGTKHMIDIAKKKGLKVFVYIFNVNKGLFE